MGNIYQKKTKSKQSIKQFDSRIKSWEFTSQDIVQSRIENYNKFEEFKIDEECICAPSGTQCTIRVNKRIGSESIEGYVFEIQIEGKKGLKAAAKITPIFDKNDEIKSHNENNIAERLSNTVLSESNPYFPIVYKVLDCKDTIYSGLNKYVNPTIVQQQILKDIHSMLTPKEMKQIRKMLQEYIKEDRIIIDTKQFVKNIKKIVGKEKAKVLNIKEKEVKIPSVILVSELAWGDLRQYIHQKRISKKLPRLDDKVLMYIIKEVYKAIEIMQQNHIVHHDLHTGNVLIMVNKNKEIVPLIHDFGKSEIVRNFSKNDYFTDLIQFLRVIESEIEKKDFPLVQKYIKKVLKKIKYYKGSPENILEFIQTI